MNTGTKPISSTKGLLTTVGYQLGTSPCVYALEGSVAVAGKVVQWLRDNMKMISKPSEIESLALAVPDNGGGYFVPAFSGLYAPYWRSDARGIICGLTGYVTREHLARASLEAVAFQVMDADLLDSKVVRPVVSETTALGAAFAAGLAVGVWKDTEELVKTWHVAKVWRSEMHEDARAKLTSEWKKAIDRTLNWAD
ncbi:hypothetical protein DYB34_011172 [Aphanomyces astaci]|uniref:Carbohydrate kinase FGGY C-terminal domain-containing protein n=1 Tax=Aphanomyces astaci TaxID=112090 RepID=A0A418BV15_APHAT|nr:hypothetical protein DYB34_011172 [Aphanomyces astaci]